MNGGTIPIGAGQIGGMQGLPQVGGPLPYQQPMQGAYNPFAAAFAQYQRDMAAQQAPHPGVAAPPPLPQPVAPVAVPQVAPPPQVPTSIAQPTATAATPEAQPYSAQSIAALISSLNAGTSGQRLQVPEYTVPQAVQDALNAPARAAAAKAAAEAAAAAQPAAQTPVAFDPRESEGNREGPAGPGIELGSGGQG